MEGYTIAERVRGGLRKARANGKKLGRPKDEVDTDKVIEYRKPKKSIRQIANELNFVKPFVRK